MQKTMNSKSIYFLMEIMIVLIFFALSAAICLQVLVSAHNTSSHAMQLRFAMQEGTNIVETMQASQQAIAPYEIEEDGITYTIDIQEEQTTYGFISGNVSITNGDTSLIVLPFAYKEEVQP